MKIKSLSIITNVGVKEYIVGAHAPGDKRIVSEIQDAGVEWENGIDFIYQVRDEKGNMIAHVENCPVDVMYFPEEETNA
jgi:hypothetical protein